MRYACLLLIFCGCYTLPVEVVNSGDGMNTVSGLRPLSEIRIYRSARPFWKFKEIGILNASGPGEPDIALLYRRFRETAALRGADAVIDFKMDTERKVVSSTELFCDRNGHCMYVKKNEVQINFTANATLIVKTGEKK